MNAKKGGIFIFHKSNHEVVFPLEPLITYYIVLVPPGEVGTAPQNPTLLFEVGRHYIFYMLVFLTLPCPH